MHAIIIAGITKGETFYEQTNISTDIITKIFRARLLAVLQKKGIITEELVSLLLSWNHNSGFNVHTKKRIEANNKESIETIARYMSKPAISYGRVAFNPADNNVTVYEKQKGSYPNRKATYTIMEFMALITSHIPYPYESLVYYYGAYSSSHRGKENKLQKGNHNLNTQQVKGTKAAVNGKITSAWARLIRHIFEIEVLTCTKCQSQMRIIAFITNPKETGKILKHLGEETKRSPPLVPITTTTNNHESDPWDYDHVPPDEIYECNEEYADEQYVCEA